MGSLDLIGLGALRGSNNLNYTTGGSVPAYAKIVKGFVRQAHNDWP
ncbi:MAG: hypothetical protein K0Q74_1100 [Gammaproteobacteria bacterium]|jgi:hypothetical protein|nr:hypothetical protein [Gammaproteobacteria bacterium]